jgi:hypothetical protein
MNLLDNLMNGHTFACCFKKPDKKIMKKVFAMFAVAGLLFTASCGNKEVTEETTEVEVVIEETEEVTEETVEEATEEVEGATEEVKEVVEG